MWLTGICALHSVKIYYVQSYCRTRRLLVDIQLKGNPGHYLDYMLSILLSVSVKSQTHELQLCGRSTRQPVDGCDP